jgi:hypothetical protein
MFQDQYVITFAFFEKNLFRIQKAVVDLIDFTTYQKKAILSGFKEYIESNSISFK